MKKRILSVLLALSLFLALLPGAALADDASPIPPEDAAVLADVADAEEICAWIALEPADGEDVKTMLDTFARDYLLGCNYCYPLAYTAPVMVLSCPKEHLLRMAGDSRVKAVRLFHCAKNGIHCQYLNEMWLWGEGASAQYETIDQTILDYAALTDSLIPVEIRLRPIQTYYVNQKQQLADYKGSFIETYLAGCEIPYNYPMEPTMIAIVPLETVYAMAEDERTELLLLALNYPYAPGEDTSGSAFPGTITEIREAYQALHPELSLADIEVTADYGSLDDSRIVTIKTARTPGEKTEYTFRTYAYRDGEFLPTAPPEDDPSDIDPAPPTEEGDISEPVRRAVFAAACESYQRQNPEYALSQIRISDDLGSVSDCRAMLLSVRPSILEAGVMMTYEEIAGYVFRIMISGAPSELCVLIKGEYVPLADAYEDGIVSEADIGTIYKRYFYDYGSSDPPCAKVITAAELCGVCKTYLAALKKDSDNVHVTRDYGLYGGESDFACGPLRIVLVSFGSGASEDLTLRADDLIFRVPAAEAGEQLLLAYQDGYFISLDRACEYGILTDEESDAFFRDFWADGCNPFDDVAPDSWYHDDVSAAFRDRLMNGVSDTLFAPNDTMTRAMLVTVLWRAMGSPGGSSHSFTDVPAGTWYSDAVAWAAANGIVNGVGDGKFAPNSPITREQFVTILHRLQLSPACEAALPFADAGAVSPWATSAMCWAVQAGILTGSARPDGIYLDPAASATRAQAAAILNRYMTIVE